MAKLATIFGMHIQLVVYFWQSIGWTIQEAGLLLPLRWGRCGAPDKWLWFCTTENTNRSGQSAKNTRGRIIRSYCRQMPPRLEYIWACFLETSTKSNGHTPAASITRMNFWTNNCVISSRWTAVEYLKAKSLSHKRARKLLEDTTRRTSTGSETGLNWKVDDREFRRRHWSHWRRN